MKKILKGHCHCEKVSWVYPLVLESVTACNCTLCRKYGAMWAYGSIEEGIIVSGETKIYMRKDGIHEYHFCNNCGCLTHNQAKVPNKEGLTRIVVNLRLIDDPTLIEDLPIDHFEGLVSFEDLPRDHRCVRDLWF